MSNQNRTILLGLWVATIIIVVWVVRSFFPPEPDEIKPPDTARFEKAIDSAGKAVIKANDSIAKLNEELSKKAKIIYINHQKLDTDLSHINSYSNLSGLVDSLYSTR